MGQHPELRQLGLQSRQHGLRAVSAGVIHEDHLVRAAGERGGDLARERAHIAFLVEDRDHHGDFRRHACSSLH